MNSEEMQNREAGTVTIHDPEMAKMFESAAPTMGDIPRAILLGRTEDGRTREDFETEDDFEYEMLMVGIEHATIADVSAHLAYEGKKARAAYLHILSLAIIRDKVLERAGGDPEAKFMETVNGHLAEHGNEPETKGDD